MNIINIYTPKSNFMLISYVSISNKIVYAVAKLVGCFRV